MDEETEDVFSAVTRDTLTRFHNTAGQCVSLCAYISTQLIDQGVDHRLALGSLSCRNIKAFQYRNAIPTRPDGLVDWEGHAWIEFQNGYIGEPSLIRTARALPPQSNLRTHLDRIGLLGRGAFIMDAHARKEASLKYTVKGYLLQKRYPEFIAGLEFLQAQGRN